MERKASASKILCLGVDGLDPRLTRKYVDEGKMPHVARYIERGACRQDLVLLGAHPTVTPPMWTTLATGAYANTHGITGFYHASQKGLEYQGYNLDSRNSKAEPLWNCFAEAGKKTLVWHWPGSSWPPTSDSPNLLVVDGTVPGSVNTAAQVEAEFILGANTAIKEVTFLAKAAGDSSAACVIDNLQVDESAKSHAAGLGAMATAPDKKSLIIDGFNEGQMGSHKPSIDVVQSPIKPASGWEKAPADALEFTMLLGQGLLRRPCLILKNEQGIYDHIALYKSKKAAEPLTVIRKGEFKREIIDEGLKGDDKITVNRNMTVLELKEDGSQLKMWVSAAMDISHDLFWHPQSLHKLITENIGYPPPTTMLGSQDPQLITNCMLANWYHISDWQSSCLKYLMDNEEVEVIFSHFHGVDLQSHRFIRYMHDKGQNLQPEEVFYKFMEDVYVQTDYYLGQFLDYLDEGWTILIFSDHAQVCPTYNPPGIGDITGINIELMQKLGFTVLKTDEKGQTLREIDWSKTRAIAWGEQHIYLNLIGRTPHGIIDPADQYEVEEEIMTALYGYRHPQTGKRVIAVALRNKDAVLLGQGGPEAGDILYWTAEGYNYDHADTLSTAWGEGHTSVSPIFIAAGQGIKAGFTTDRVIRQVDFAPTVAVLGGVSMPAQCEGAPVYQILTEEY